MCQHTSLSKLVFNLDLIVTVLKSMKKSSTKTIFQNTYIYIYSVLSFEQTDRMQCKNRFSW